MVGVLTISTQFVVKTAAIGNLGSGAYACQAAIRAFGPAGLAFAPRTGKAASLRAGRWWGFRLRHSSSPVARVLGRICSEVHFFCSCRSAAAILAMAVGWTVGRAWASRFSVPVKCPEH